MTFITCGVCAEDKRADKSIPCANCEYHACVDCVTTYFETNHQNTLDCMNCHRPLMYEYLSEKCGSAAMKRIVASQKERLFREQRSVFPHTQEAVTLTIECEKVDTEIKELTKQINLLKSQRAVKRLLASRLSREYNNRHNNQGYSTARVTNTLPSDTLTKKVSYIRPCGTGECKGFVRGDSDDRNNTVACDLCHTCFCKKCMNEKTADQDHVCNESDVLTVHMLRKDSKPCPKCSVMIHRISGCPDMFCVDCHTAFNWDTLAIHTNGNSNPHYYAWMQQHSSGQRTRTRNGCGTTTNSNADLRAVMRFLRDVKSSICPKDACDAIVQAIQDVHHTVNNMIIPGAEADAEAAGGHRGGHRGNGQSTSNDTNDTNTNTAVPFIESTLLLRIKYMRGGMSENQFKQALMRKYKSVDYARLMNEMKRVILDQMTHMMNGVLRIRRYMAGEGENANESVEMWMEEHVRFSMYMNDCYKHIRKVFGYSMSAAATKSLEYCGRGKGTNTATGVLMRISENVKAQCARYDSIVLEYANHM
jgi:hypothetical protein